MKNFTKILFTFLLIIASNQTLKAQDEGVYYEGTINGNLEIEMYLEYKGKDELRSGMTLFIYEGWYYYKSQDKSNKLPLKGVYYSTQYYLNEGHGLQITGYFDLEPNGSGGFQGTWTAYNEDENFPVFLREK